MFEPIGEKKTKLFEKVVIQIRNAILSGELKPGDRLPPEREMAELFCVSRTCIREAVRTLGTLGLVEIKHGQGVFISEAPITGFETINHLSLNDKNLADLFAMRRLLETQAAVWATAKRHDELLIELSRIVTEAKNLLGQDLPTKILLLAEHDYKFHLTLAKATGNSVLVRIMEGLLDLLAESRARAWAIPGRPYRSVDEHCEILNAILAGDREAAGRAMVGHLQNVEKDILVRDTAPSAVEG